jgi:hypothetical protein
LPTIFPVAIFGDFPAYGTNVGDCVMVYLGIHDAAATVDIQIEVFCDRSFRQYE